MRTRWAVGVIAGILLGLGAVMAIEASTDDASAQSGFTVSAAQLQTNQKISQAAVRRSNRSLNYLAPIRTAQTDSADNGNNGVRPLSQIPGAGQGWTSSQIADGAITRSKVSQGLLAYWAVVDNQGNLVRSQPAGTASGRIEAGRYTVTFPAAIEQCAYQVSISSPNNQPPTPLNNGAISAFAQSATTIEVRTYSIQVTPPVLQDRPFHLTVNC